MELASSLAIFVTVSSTLVLGVGTAFDAEAQLHAAAGSTQHVEGFLFLALCTLLPVPCAPGMVTKSLASTSRRGVPSETALFLSHVFNSLRRLEIRGAP